MSFTHESCHIWIRPEIELNSKHKSMDFCRTHYWYTFHTELVAAGQKNRITKLFQTRGTLHILGGASSNACAWVNIQRDVQQFELSHALYYALCTYICSIDVQACMYDWIGRIVVRPSLSVYIYAYVYIYVCSYIHVLKTYIVMCACVRVCLRVCVRVCVCVCVCVSIYTHVCMDMWCI